MGHCCGHATDPAHAAFVLILTRLETLMTTQAEAFAALSTKIDDIKADFTALLEQLAAERENLSEAGQAALDALTAKVDDLDTSVGDADGSDAPPPPPADDTEPMPV